ncbi:MAG: glycosyltransferase family 9 protein [Thermodesulfobacteriota bacterium]
MKILVIRLSSIGDIILTTPIIRALRKKYPEAAIDFLVMDRFRDAINGHPDISNILEFKRDQYRGLSGILRFSRTLKSTKYDLVIDLHAKLRSRLICRALKTRTLRYIKRSFWKTMGVRLHLMRYQVDDTIVRNYFRPLRPLGISPGPEKLSFAFTRKDTEAVTAFSNRIVLAPGAANPTKKWPAKYFSDLGRLMNQPIVLLGGPEDKEDLEVIRQHIGPGMCENLAGKLSLKQSGALLSIARFVVTNDSGPFHMARAGGRPVFVIFGPTDPNMFTFNQNETLIYSREPCAPCSLHGDDACPKGHFRCMLNLTPEIVFNTIQNRLGAMNESLNLQEKNGGS